MSSLKWSNPKRHWVGTLYLKKESGLGWTPLPEVGHVADKASDVFKQIWRCNQFHFASPAYHLLDFTNDSSLDNLFPILFGLADKYDFLGCDLSAAEQLHSQPFFILSLEDLVEFKRLTSELDSIIEMMQSWREVNRQVVLCLTYVI